MFWRLFFIFLPFSPSAQLSRVHNKQLILVDPIRVYISAI